MQRASHKRYPKLITESPRAYQGSQQAVRALMNDDTSAEAFYLAALGAAGPRACFLCASTSHLAPECPRFKAINEDDFARRSLARLLGNSAPPSRSPRKTSFSKDTKFVRQLAQGSADDDADEDSASAGEGVFGSETGEGDAPDDERLASEPDFH
jgi:hypothetical protein